MACPSCGAENRPGRRFCAECGTALAAPCPACGASNEPGEKFCGECGTRLAVEALAAGAQPAPQATGQPADSTAASAGSGAERRLVSVLFADLEGFTALSEQRDAEEVRDLQSRYFTTLERIIGRYGGTVEKFIGDAVMAVWGTPTAHEDDPERAVRAALEATDAVAGLAGEVGLSELHLRAAVMTGEAVVALGARGQGMVTGDLVNTASRLQSAAPAGAVLIGETTYRAVKDAVACEPFADQAVKGKAAPVAAWRALQVVSRRGGSGRGAGLEPPFVGRAAELRLLKDLYHAATSERRTRLVSVTGVAGVGKSRLVAELQKYLDGIVETTYWHQGRSPSYGEGVTFWALGEMVRRRAGIAETDDEATSREKLAAATRQFVPEGDERTWIEPRLAALLGLDAMPDGERGVLFAAWRTFFERIAERGPVVLVFEELQWADHGLLDFIESLLQWSRDRPLFIVTLGRPELLDRRPTWGAGQRDFTSLHLDPLPEAAMRELLAGTVPGLPEAAVRSIVARAEGIPLYAVETLRTLIDGGQLVPDEAGRYRLTGELPRLEVPPTLQALIGARLDALEPAERALVQDAAVLGQSFTPAALSAVSGQAPDGLESVLQRLVRKELLAHDMDPRSPERGQYAFVQSLIREVAYGTLARSDRRSRHLAAARFFEAAGDEELAGVLAGHYVAALRASADGPEADALASQARIALRAAAERAAALHSHEQAIAYVEQALEITSDASEVAALHERAAASAQVDARYERVEEHARAALEHYRSVDDLAGVARAATRLGRARSMLSELGASRRDLEGAVTGTEALGDHPDRAELIAELARTLMLADKSGPAIEMADRALLMAAPLDLAPVIVEALITRGAAIGKSGRQTEALAITLGAAELASMRGLVSSELRARYNVTGQLLTEDPRAALANARVAYDRARRIGQRQWTLTFANWVSGAAFWTGEWEDSFAVALEHEAEDLPPPARLTLATNRASHLALLGRLEEAEAALAGAEPLLSVIDRPDDRAIFLLNRWFLTFARRSFAAAFDDALEIFRVNPQFALPAHDCAARAATWLRDPARLAAAVEGIRRQPDPGRLSDAVLAGARAALAGLEGRRDEAVAIYRDVLARFRELDVPVWLAIYLVEFVFVVGPDLPETRAAAAEARELIGRLGLRPYGELLEMALSRQPEAASPATTSSSRGVEPSPSAAPTRAGNGGSR
ncbi:MAG TPA: adenylate/guanylate cyclase domain-containing protein [Candidatus Limnocylindrales bacterium]|nr:adenylate/guanylate cyclase domain-containing protein [Candidatus Limnocylindrales bacterium]